MNRPSLFSLASAMALTFGIQAVSAAAPPPMGGPEHGGGMHEMMRPGMHGPAMAGERKGYAEVVLKHTQELKLTDEQIGKITRIEQENQQKLEEIGKKAHESMRTAHELFLDPAADEAAIRKSAQTHAAAFNDLVESALKAREAINEVLKPDQLQKLKSLKAEH